MVDRTGKPNHRNVGKLSHLVLGPFKPNSNSEIKEAKDHLLGSSFKWLSLLLSLSLSFSPQLSEGHRPRGTNQTHTYLLKLQALGKLIFYRHITHVTQKVQKLCFLRGKQNGRCKSPPGRKICPNPPHSPHPPAVWAPPGAAPARHGAPAQAPPGVSWFPAPMIQAEPLKKENHMEYSNLSFSESSVSQKPNNMLQRTKLGCPQIPRIKV